MSDRYVEIVLLIALAFVMAWINLRSDTKWLVILTSVLLTGLLSLVSSHLLVAMLSRGMP